MPVVDNRGTAELDYPWTVDAEPFVEIGGAPGDPRDQLFEVVEAARLADGWMVVANGGTHEVRFYAEDGAYLAAFGREGGGPREFRRIHRRNTPRAGRPAAPHRVYEAHGRPCVQPPAAAFFRYSRSTSGAG